MTSGMVPYSDALVWVGYAMSITIDPSTPSAITAERASPSTGSIPLFSLTSPSTDSLLVALLSATATLGGTGATISAIPGAVFTPVISSNGGGFFGSAASCFIWELQLLPSPPPMTVSISLDFSFETWQFQVLVLTGCNSTQSGAASGTSTSGLGGTTSSEVTLTPTGSGSLIVANTACYQTAVSNPSLVAGFTSLAPLPPWFYFGEGLKFADGIGAAAGGTAGSPVTVGWTFGGTPCENTTCAVEILQ